ncbi:tetratricopeptide repeat protein [Tunturiibacter psychrotolerans]|jgi:tetratricopeptide (TPR) repeat protein|uniref:tetratricopeptide repeat protein n=1 Tax=Tunturiibacter psychrotolerans TaxID=3069686 RepID=UPI003D2048E0
MRPLLRSTFLLPLLGLVLSNSPLSSQKLATPAAPDADRDLRHQSADWFAIEPHLPDPQTASWQKLELAADVLRARRFPEDALDYYGYAMRRGGPQQDLLIRMGVTELELRNITLARTYFLQVVRLQKKNAQGWNNLGAAEYVEGRYGSAISDYSKAIKLDKKSAIYHSNLGTAYFEEKNFERARQQFDIALTLDPDMMQHHEASGVEAHMLSPADHAHYCFEIARLYAHRGDEENMLRYLTLSSEGGFDVLGSMGSDEVLAKYRKDPRVITLVRTATALRNSKISVADARTGGVPSLPQAHD